MSDKTKSKERARRIERRAEALRENLRRRKLQARGREAASRVAGDGPKGQPEEPQGSGS